MGKEKNLEFGENEKEVRGTNTRGLENPPCFQDALRRGFIEKHPDDPFVVADDFSSFWTGEIRKYATYLKSEGLSDEEVDRLVSIKQDEIFYSNY